MIVAPGATLGVLGSGQLGRMFAIAARRLGYRVHTLSPDDDSPTGQIADEEVSASYDDLGAVRAFAQRIAVATFEFENVPAATVGVLADAVPVRPSGSILHVSQHRAREKRFLDGIGVPVAPFRVVDDVAGLDAAIAELGCPAILKTASFGYDGKGQVRIATPADVPAAWASIGEVQAVLEAVVPFELEVSVIVARGLDGAIVDYGVIENVHERHILDVSICPARVSSDVAHQAVTLARRIAEGLDLVGVLCTEMFVTPGGGILVNELAPRPHNSGHLTIDAHVTCQFEQQVRAVCGLPLGSTAALGPAAMANLLGDVWERGEPRWDAALSDPRVKLHLYGKRTPKAARKMGHLTAVGTSVEEAERAVRQARQRLLDA